MIENQNYVFVSVFEKASRKVKTFIVLVYHAEACNALRGAYLRDLAPGQNSSYETS